MNYTNKTIHDTFSAVSTEKEGLTQDEALKRLKLLPPVAKSRSIGPLVIALRQLKGPLVLVLLVAMLVTGLLGEWVDTIVIFVALAINSGLGFIEEYKADNSLKKLKEFLPKEVLVRREGVERVVAAKEVVPGDIMILAAGEKVYADGRIYKSTSFEVDESALTGESLPVEKKAEVLAGNLALGDRQNMVFAGTLAVSGRAEVVVTAVRDKTEIGKVASLVSEAEKEDTLLQRDVRHISMLIGKVVVGLSVIVFALSAIRGSSLAEGVYLAVALAVAAVPEGLVIALTVVLAVAMQRMLKRRALVRRLISAETLGSVSVICFDKTGTITEGDMRIARTVELSKDDPNDILAHLMFYSGGEKSSPTDRALHDYLKGDPVEPNDYLPFDSEYKFAASSKDENLFVVGAPDILLARCDISDKEHQQILGDLNNYAKKGYRTIMLAKGIAPKYLEPNTVRDLTPVAIYLLEDPIRSEAKAAIDTVHAAGIYTVMVTGDHPHTAASIARRVGMLKKNARIVTGSELHNMTDHELRESIYDIAVFARVSPSDKLRIIKAFHARRASVAMTGDGVNDAPALKAAEIGVTVGSGTEIAKESADLILLNSSFAVIVDAVKEGRVIFDNMRKIVLFLLVTNFIESTLTLLALVFGLPIPLLPIHILWINLITDIFPALAMTFEPAERDILTEKPRTRDEKIINGWMLRTILLTGLLSAALIFGVYTYLYEIGYSIETLRSFAFLSVGLTTVFTAFAARLLRRSVFSTQSVNPWLIVATGIELVLQFMPFATIAIAGFFELERDIVPILPYVAGVMFIGTLGIEIAKWRKRS
jgi:Ca2+-transporting ATPase